MRKIAKLLLICALLAVCIQLGTLLADKYSLQENIVRLHVVADSDSDTDQAQKLLVRDAVMEYIQSVMPEVSSKEAVQAFLQENLAELKQVADQTLANAGSGNKAVVTLEREEFGKRDYDTFSLPSGVYDSLRVTIGSGNGKNWWCVIFPSFCLPAAGQTMQDTAVSSGFAASLTDTLQNKDGYEIRFCLLDCLGKVENFFRFD